MNKQKFLNGEGVSTLWDAVKSIASDINTTIEDNELVTATALNDLDARVNSIENGESENSIIVAGSGEGSGVMKGAGNSATGKNSFAIGQDNQTISENSVATGNNNIAGLKGWYYGSINKIDDTTIDVYISDSQRGILNYPTWGGTTIFSNLDPYSVLGVDTVVSLINDVKYDNKFKVVGGEAGRIRLQTVSGNLPFSSIAKELVLDPEDYSIYCLSMPTVGAVDVSLSSMAEGRSTKALGACSHAEGYNTTASGKYSHVEGRDTEALYIAHAEGSQTKALGNASHTEGTSTHALNSNAHAEGFETEVRGYAGHGEGKGTKVLSDYGHSEGELTVVSTNSNSAHAEGIRTKASNTAAHAEGRNTIAAGVYSHAEGYNADNNVDYGAFGAISHTEGYATKTTVNANSGHAEGRNTTAAGMGAHAEGISNTASGEAAHAEGSETVASGDNSHAEGYGVNAEGSNSHAEGIYTTAAGINSHAEGYNTDAQGSGSHAEGYYTKAVGIASHAEGKGESVENPNLAQGDYSHVEGEKTKTLGAAAHAEGGSSIAIGNFSHSEGRFTRAHALCSHAEGFSVEGKEDEYGAFGPISHVEGYANITTSEANSAHAEGRLNTVSGMGAHVEGISNTASGEASHAEGYNTQAISNYSHAEGNNTTASGNYSHAEGDRTLASKKASHTEGGGTIASGIYSHAEGYGTEASGKCSHAEGGNGAEEGNIENEYIFISVKASGDYSHAEGSLTHALGDHSHAEGNDTLAEGTSSHAEGMGTVAHNHTEHAQGMYNKSNANTIHSVGVGTFYNDRKNAHEIMDDGKHYIIGIGGYDGTNPDTSYDLATYLPNMVNIAYDELVSLRDNSQLIPGQQYRITDYVTTTSQAGTTSANHPFDIIVTALDESTLSENASAIKSARDVENYFGTENLEAWQLKYCLDNDTERFAWADVINSHKAEFVAMFWDDPVNGTNYNDHIKQDKICDWGTEYDPETEIDNIVIYKSDTTIYKDEGSADYDDKYFYRGIIEVDGKEYDSWKKFEVSQLTGVDDWVTNNEGHYQYALTERIVFDGQVIWPENIDDRKGVIYNMIDEYGNECPYDFKNIKFYYNGLRIYVYTFTWLDDSYNVMDTSIFGNNGTLTCSREIYGVYGNVIKPHIERIQDEDSGEFLGTKQLLNNITFISDYALDGVGNDGFYGCYNNIFGNDCHRNIFGNDCHRNIFGNSCYGNSFGNSCYDNSFGINCYDNSFGINCYDNSFGNNCYTNSFNHHCISNSFEQSCSNNSFGNNCERNSFGTGCYSNSFGNNCFTNSFGNSCRYNSFGDNCTSNSFGTGCDYNTFGNNCYINSFGNNCFTNSFGNSCYANSFGDNCTSNSFGNNCDYNTFGNNCDNNAFGYSCQSNSFGNSCQSNRFRVMADVGSPLQNYVRYNHLDDGCSYNIIGSSGKTGSSNKLQNININRGVRGTASSNNYFDIDIDLLNSEKEININNYNGHIYIDYGDTFKVTYSELWILRKNSQLIPGRQYRIIDYVTTTSQENTQSAGHPFDIIVTAINEYTLSEEAQAIQNINDGYFDDSNLSAWKIWYSIDNDTDRFEWAGSEIIVSEEVEGIDTSNCTISVGYSYDEEEGLNKFDNRVSFVSQVWDDPGDEAYLEGSAIDELISHWGYETEPNGFENCLTLYGLSLEFDEETGEITSENGITGDRWYYRGIITVDNTDYDYWEKAEWGRNNEGFGYMDKIDYYGRKLFFLTDRIVSGEPIITTTTVETVIQLNPKGVIYRMIDEFNNDCPYDFKNIQFKHPKNTTIYPDYYYTFSTVINGVVTDHSLLRGYCYGNIMKEYIDDSKKQRLNNNVFLNTSKTSYCYSNSFGNNCWYNFVGNHCHNNSFGNHCSYNSVGDDCLYNSFGNGCWDNLFGLDCISNSFGNHCSYNSFGNHCSYNSFGNHCRNNSFRVNTDTTAALKNHVQYNHLDDGCSYNVIWNSKTTSSSVLLKNINVNRGVCVTEISDNIIFNMINIDTLNADYEIQVSKNSNGEIKIYCEADLIA